VRFFQPTKCLHPPSSPTTIGLRPPLRNYF
jgi:hypothetical protein